MKAAHIIAIAIPAIIIAVFLAVHFEASHTPSPAAATSPGTGVPTVPPSAAPSPTEAIRPFVPPLDRVGERVTKKPFGILVSPGRSPIQPERFSGYHTGADFEIFPEEADSRVSVRAICEGKILAARIASGYGGVVVESCTLDGQPLTVVYGHLALQGLQVTVGQKVAANATLGDLGAAFSRETDGERQHLHLGIHRGSTVDLRGYVPDRPALAGWVDPCLFICR